MIDFSIRESMVHANRGGHGSRSWLGAMVGVPSTNMTPRAPPAVVSVYLLAGKTGCTTHTHRKTSSEPRLLKKYPETASSNTILHRWNPIWKQQKKRCFEASPGQEKMHRRKDKQTATTKRGLEEGGWRKTTRERFELRVFFYD